MQKTYLKYGDRLRCRVFTVGLLIFAFNLIFGQSLRTGDLLFQGKGNSDFSKAIAASTDANDSINFVHVGLALITAEGLTKIVEASPEEGVRIIGLEEFLNNSPQIDGSPYVVVKRLNIVYSLDTAVRNALTFLGQPYDWWYLPDNGKIYCSELIYESFIDEDGKHLFQSKPMSFTGPDGTIPEFWIDLYQRLGMDVPQGVMGTNPNDLSRDPNLTEVLRFF